MHFIFDVETTGLPKSLNPRHVSAFDRCRIISISWIILNDELNEIERKNHYIKGDFIISKESIKVHGLTKEFLEVNGKDISYVINDLKKDLVIHNIKTLVAHNIRFDVNVLLSELYRINDFKTIAIINRKDTYCTMYKAQEILKLSRRPKLSILYETITSKKMENHHDSLYDTIHCCDIYKHLLNATST